MLKTKDAIEARRSIRKFRTDPVDDTTIHSLLDAARLAPSGCNAQPWRFRIVKDYETRLKLSEAACSQSFIARAPVVLVCCADLKGYIEGAVTGIQDIGDTGAIEERIVQIIIERTRGYSNLKREQIEPRIAFNVAIAVEHIVLRALDFGLGTCWVRLFDEGKIRKLFGWDTHISVVAMLPLGYPDEAPPQRKRLRLEEILI